MVDWNLGLLSWITELSLLPPPFFLPPRPRSVCVLVFSPLPFVLLLSPLTTLGPFGRPAGLYIRYLYSVPVCRYDPAEVAPLSPKPPCPARWGVATTGTGGAWDAICMVPHTALSFFFDAPTA